MGGYPTGPLPCGTVYDPTCKIRIPNMTHGGPLVVFSFWVLVFVACSLFQMYKAWHLKRHPVYPVVRGGAAADGSSMSSVKSKPEKKNKKKNSSGSFTRDDTTKEADSELGAATQVVVNVVEEEEEGFKLKEQQHVHATVRARIRLALKELDAAGVDRAVNPPRATSPNEIEGAVSHRNVRLGQMLLERRRYDKAEGRARLVLARDPRYVPAHVLMGQALAAQGRCEDAARAFDDALRLEPANAAALAGKEGCRGPAR